MKKILEYKSTIIISVILILIIFPFFGEMGWKVYDQLGKYYMILTLGLLALLFLIFSIKINFKLILNKKVIFSLVSLIIYVLVLYINKFVDINNMIFLIYSLAFIIFLSFVKIDEKVLKYVGTLALILLICFAFLSIPIKMENFNPNTYAYVVFFLSILTILSFENRYFNWILTVLVLGLTIYLINAVYKTETQLIGVITMCFFLFIVRKMIFKFKFIYITLIIGVMLFSISLPIITKILVEKNILQSTILSNRPELWLLCIEEILQKGAFLPAALDFVIMPHNAFLKLALTYSSTVMIIIAIILCYFLIIIFNKIKNDNISQKFILLFCVILIMCSVENLLVEIATAYFFFISLSIIISRVYLIDNKQEDKA